MLSVLSGLLSALSLPAVFVTPWASYNFPDMGWLAWFAFVPFYRNLAKATSVAAGFRKGFALGAVHFGMTVYWIVIAMHRYGEVPLWGSFLALILMIVVFALFPAAAAAGAVFLRRRGVSFGWAWIFCTAVLEFLRNYVPLGGFPWASVAYSQRSFVTLLQILDVTGVYGILLILLLANVALAEIRRTRSYAVVFVVLFTAMLAYGHFRLADVRKDVAARPTLRIGIVQGNIPQEEKWVDEKIGAIIDHHMELTERLQGKAPDLIFWPEAAFPAVLPPEITKIAELKGLTVPLLMGVVRYDGVIPEDWPPKDPYSFRLYNSAVLVGPEGEIEDRYDKVHLVPVGEYVPLEDVFPFMKDIVPAMNSFTRGNGFHLMTLTPRDLNGLRAPLPNRERGLTSPESTAGEGARFGVTICYEDLFPQISRTFTDQGADFLVNLTNDGWYERSSAVFQHFDFSRYRAVENRRAMVRVTNTGVTAVFSPTGEIFESAVLPPFQEGTLSTRVPLGGLGSFYRRFGDWLAWVCVAALVLLCGKALFTRRADV